MKGNTMAVDRETIENANAQAPSVALTLAAIAKIAAVHPDLSVSDQRTRAAALVLRNALGLDSQGQIMIRPNGFADVQKFALAILGEGAPGTRSTKLQRAAARERELEAVLVARRAPQGPLSIEPEYRKRVSEDAALQGQRPEAKARRARLREELLEASFRAAGVHLAVDS